MARQHFDDLARALAQGGATRRNALRILTGGALASVGVTSMADATGKTKGDGQVHKQGSGGQKNPRKCLPPGRICLRKGDKSDSRLCKNCCGSVTQLTKNKGRCCNHNGLLCGTTDQCCLGVCTDGTCQNNVIELPPAPPLPGDPAPPPPPPPPTCVVNGQLCPAGCNPAGSCAGCCGGYCDGNVKCSPNV